MSMSLNAVTLALPKIPVARTETWTGEQRRSHDGTLLTDYTNASIGKWRLEWNKVSHAERATIRTRYEVVTSQTMSLPQDAGPYTVVVMRGTWDERAYSVAGATSRYDITFNVEEAV